jgi:hypothetical protein
MSEERKTLTIIIVPVCEKKTSKRTRMNWKGQQQCDTRYLHGTQNTKLFVVVDVGLQKKKVLTTRGHKT